MKQVISLIVSILICFSAAAAGSQFMPGEWYAGLNKPSWNPPSWLFGPVWTTLYIMMGVSLWIVWKDHGLQRAKIALIVFLIQLVLNGLWTYLFFGLQNPGLAFAEIVMLWILILVTIILFIKHSLVAGMLLVPYLLWVSFASVLNYTIWKLNS